MIEPPSFAVGNPDPTWSEAETQRYYLYLAFLAGRDSTWYDEDRLFPTNKSPRDIFCEWLTSHERAIELREKFQ